VETLRGSLYDHPAWYDVAYGADCAAELGFLMACFKRHARGAVRRVFEPACGTGRLLYRLSKRGYCVSGLDLNLQAVEYCNRRLARHGLPETAVVGDMCAFRLPRRADGAFNTVNSFRHLLTERQARLHLACMAAAIRKGGVYVLGLCLTPTRAQPTEGETWSARRGHLQVNVRMARIGADARRRLERFQLAYDVYTPTRRVQLVEEVAFRSYTAIQLRRLLAAAPQFELVAAYDFAYDIERPIEIDAGTEDVVCVLQRR
jgi:SAM-dependent methyltransferase